ncbi:hypothetical protein [Leptolyngbya sp. FACHB-16]|uniref:hypothetical protein n=1 Tax=unclassified Leptolyngbya TaxID=2650499 RepID=UPI00168550B9|nr:hypothetical protein [Leptolyngbya sp. FACHB-16]MBD2157606.1 hypothetical protein [Leptolyngbya sp. FACHB-16]
MKLPPECWCFAREAGKAPTFWVNSYAETSLKVNHPHVQLIPTIVPSSRRSPD